MLHLRIITALVLLAVLIPVLAYGSWQLGAGVALVFVTLGAWEWMRLLRWGALASVVGAAVWALGLLLSGLYWPTQSAWTLLGLSAIVWGLAVPVWLARGLPTSWGFPSWWLTGVGAIVLAATWWGLVAALQRGSVFLLSIMVVVWISDIAAYFFGRTFGRHKLAPSISPGKTWEGVAGAVLCVSAVSSIYVFAPRAGLPETFADVVISHGAMALLCVVMWLLVALGIVGDLFESQLKRRAGMKDSSHLLPGHGGILDRIDALLPTVPAAVLLDAIFRGQLLMTVGSP